MFKDLQVGTRNEETRNKWVEKKLMEVPAGFRILDAGAGEQRYKSFCSHLQYVSQDFGKYNGKGDGTGLQTGNWDISKLDIVSDITEIPEPDASFGAILCTEVFEHLPNPLLAIDEFSRLLKPGGILILTAPFCSLTHFAPYHFYSGFNKYFYETNLKLRSLDILEMQANGNYFEYMGQEVRRIQTAGIQYSKSKCNLFEKVALRVVLNVLQRFSKKDAGSDDLLCFGYQIVAKKLEK